MKLSMYLLSSVGYIDSNMMDLIDDFEVIASLMGYEINTKHSINAFSIYRNKNVLAYVNFYRDSMVIFCSENGFILEIEENTRVKWDEMFYALKKAL